MKYFNQDFSDLQDTEYYNQQMALLQTSIADADERAATAWERTKNYEVASYTRHCQMVSVLSSLNNSLHRCRLSSHQSVREND